MSLLADSSPSSKMHPKRLLESDGFFSHRPDNFKHRKLNSVRNFPEKCGPTADSDIISLNPNVTSSSDNIKRSKVDFVRDFPEKCGPSSAYNNKINNNKVEMCALAFPAVPLRCLPPSCNVKMDIEKKNVFSSEESGKRDSDKLVSVIAEAKNYANTFDLKSSASGQILDFEDFDQLKELKPLTMTLKEEEEGEEEEGAGERILSESNCELIKINALVEQHSDRNIKTGIEGNNEPKNYDDSKKDLINLSIVKHPQPHDSKVKKVLELFEIYYKEIVKGHEMHPKGERKCTYSHLEAAQRLKKEGKHITPEKPFGHIPGVEIGDEFRFRSQLAVIGLHRQLVAGIDHVVLGGKKYATSVVDSGRYENTAKNQDILIYSGQGGNPKIGKANNSADQKLERGNLALKNSMEMGYPVRVTYKMSLTGHHHCVVYVYGGLYTVNNVREERDQTGKLVFKFELHRMLDQPRCRQIDAKIETVEIRKEVCVMEDISRGKERLSIRAMNGVDDDSPPPFTYVTRMIYPYWYYQDEPVGCDCVNGCSDSHQCHCVVKNGGEIPYNEKGSIIRKKPRIHECGPSCKCPPTCMNRVTQLGLRFRLEIFKTKKRGWGVRSRDLIPSGGFICEYLGEFLRDKEADLRVNDEYLFDIYNSRVGRAGFAVDAATCGNIGRFINHSCSPNLYAQDVLHDHGDKRMPHVMFFATKDIPPLQELCYDYNYKLDTVCDANGNVKTKDCYCGSHECTKRMY